MMRFIVSLICVFSIEGMIIVSDAAAYQAPFPHRHRVHSQITPTPTPDSTPVATPTPIPSATPAPTSSTGGGSAGYSQPCGIFSVDATLDLSYVDGKLIRVFWNSVQTDSTTYNWSSIDKQLTSLQAIGKKASLVVFPVPNPPSWIFTAGAQSYTDGSGSVLPIPWDSVFLNAWWNFISAFGSRYAKNSTILQISATGPSGAISFSGTIPGYTSNQFIQVWNQTNDRWAAAFPDTFLALPIRFFNDGTGPMVTSGTIRDYAVNTYNKTWRHFGVFGDMLTGQTPQGSMGTLFSDTAGMYSWGGLQACGVFAAPSAWPQCTFLTNDSPALALQHGADLKATYFEFYGTDLQAAANVATFTNWHTTNCQ